MIAPEPGRGINTQTSLGVLLRNNLLACALVFAALECWRPYFFLTDDNLDGYFPFFTEIGQRLLAGQSPFVSDHLFGGGYNWLRDPAGLAWHPLYLLTSLLAGTPLHNTIIDVDAFVFILFGASGFVVLAHDLRRKMALTVSDGWIMFYTLSYSFSMIALTTGAGWVTFLDNISALPWLALGILQARPLAGVGIVMLLTMHELLGGHLAPTVSNTIFLSLFALGMSVTQRSWRPLVNWLGGFAAAALILSPFIAMMLQGFFQSYRSQGVVLMDMQANNVPLSDFPVSVLLGVAIWMLHPNHPLYTTYTFALGSCAAAWCILPAMMSRSKWSGLEAVALGLTVFGAVMVIRPVWITEIMMQVPVLRSMRWPFREFIQFQFFLHLFLLVHPPGLSVEARRLSAFFGSLVMLAGMGFYPLPPTFNSMNWDRELVLEGGCAHYWDRVRPLLKPGARIAVLIPFNLYTDNRFEEPYSLLGTFNYAELAGVVNAWGYSPTAPRDQLFTKTYAFYPFGAYRPEQKQALMAEKPDLQFIALESLHPLKITLSSRDGPTIDLTPYVPVRRWKHPPEGEKAPPGN